MITDAQKWLLLTCLVMAGWLLYLLAPILTPFAISALLAYLGDPIVDRIEARKVKRTWAVIIVFTLMTMAGLAFLLVIIPILEHQLGNLIRRLPDLLNWLQEVVLPRFASVMNIEQNAIDLEHLRQSLTENWRDLGSVAGKVLLKISQSGQVILILVSYLVLIPVVTFYLLRDWDHLVANVRDLLPRRYEPVISQLAKECDQVLGEFLHGQLLVMLGQGVIYSLGLWIIGLEFALLIGMLAGLVSFVPYLGFMVGIVVAGVAAFMQFQDVIHLVYVLIVFGIGQAIEGMVLSPLLVGERIGLHPVAVIFAVMAGGQLFGFIGILLALPVAAVIVVLLRHAHDQYMKSVFYTP